MKELTIVGTSDRISIFALSTFDTDYLLIGKDNFTKAKEVLTASGRTIIGEAD